ncbi:MAG: hypothetical protein L6R43_00480 [Planctomycetes bacterium]|nr:hypothetical protein [Planctomycetota bacterium]
MIEGVVEKRHSIAYLNERDEEEFIIDPTRVRVVSVEPVAVPEDDDSSE